MSASELGRRWLVVGAALGATVCVVGVGASSAGAFWTSSDSSNQAVAVADALPSGPAPTAAVVGDGDTVSLTFAEEHSVIGDVAISAYDVERLPVGGGAAVAVSASCDVAGTVSCTESAVPAGSWQYEVAPAVGSAWVGTYGPPSAEVSVPGPS